jgi:hypothetical protein
MSIVLFIFGITGAFLAALDFVISSWYVRDKKMTKSILITLRGLFFLAFGYFFNLGGVTLILQKLKVPLSSSNEFYIYLASFLFVFSTFGIIVKKKWNENLDTN